jgi:hypothetical protein
MSSGAVGLRSSHNAVAFPSSAGLVHQVFSIPELEADRAGLPRVTLPRLAMGRCDEPGLQQLGLVAAAPLKVGRLTPSLDAPSVPNWSANWSPLASERTRGVADCPALRGVS